MYKKVWKILVVLVLCTVFSQPILAASGDEQGGGGVRFGSYTLESGNRTTGNLVVFGGPVNLEKESNFDGDLTVFGEFSQDIESALDGQLVVLGNAQIAGSIDGNVFVAGHVDLDESAYIDGDLSVVGNVSQEDGAIVMGEIIPIDETDWDLPININIPDPIVSPELPQSQGIRTPFWLKTLTAIARAIAMIVILTLIALVVASLWPEQIERVGRTIEEASLISFGTGLLTLIVTVLAAILLTITICLSPFAILGLIVVSLGVLLGWIALGLVLGRRVLSGLFNQPQSKTALAAVIGTGLLTTMLAMSQVFGLLQTLLVFLLVPPVAGAVLLTRFGTMPYATRGGAVAPSGPAPGTSSALATSRKAPMPGENSGPSVSGVNEELSKQEDSPVSADSDQIIDLESDLKDGDGLPDVSDGQDSPSE